MCHNGLNCLIALIVTALGNGHGLAAIEDGLCCGDVAVKADEDSLCISRIVRCCTSGRDRAVVIVAGDDSQTLRMALHDALHAEGCLVRYRISVLHLVCEERAACAVNAFLETGAACIGGRVALNARNISGFDLVPAGCLRRLDSLFAAACRCILLADERNLLRCIKVRVDCEDGHIRAADERRRHIALQRSDNHRVILAGVQIGFDHVLLLVIGGFRGRALHVEHRASLLGCFLRTCHHVLGVFVRSGLEHDGNVVIAITALSLRAAAAGGAGGRAAAACEHGCHQCGGNKQCADFLQIAHNKFSFTDQKNVINAGEYAVRYC